MLHAVALDGGNRARHLRRIGRAEQVQGVALKAPTPAPALTLLHLDDAHEAREAVLLGTASQSRRS